MCYGLLHGNQWICVHGRGRIRECTLCLTDLYNSSMKEEYDEMCPIQEKDILIRDHALWYNNEISLAKKQKRKKEGKWRKLRTEVARREYMETRDRLNRVVLRRKREYYRQKTLESRSNISKLYKILDNLTGNKKLNKLPEGFNDAALANMFLDYFDQKI